MTAQSLASASSGPTFFHRQRNSTVEQKSVKGSGNTLVYLSKEIGDLPEQHSGSKPLTGLDIGMPAAGGFGVVISALGNILLSGVEEGFPIQNPDRYKDPPQILQIGGLLLPGIATPPPPRSMRMDGTPIAAAEP